MAIGDRDRVIVGVIAHERLRTDLAVGLVAGLERCPGQWLHRGQIALQPFTNRFLVTAQDVVLALAALGFEVGVELCPTGKAGDGHHEVPSGVANKPLDAALVIPLARPSIAVPKQVMRLQGAEQRGALARPVRQDLRDQAAIIVIEH